MSDVKLIRASVNASRGDKLAGEERANAATCLALSDAYREAGDEQLADLWKAVGEFLPVWQDAWRTGRAFADRITYAVDRRKLIAIDCADAGHSGASGCFLVDKTTGQVWSIKGYGKKNYVVADSLAELTESYRIGIKTFRR